jgi:spore maturation protein CgeB
VSWRSVSARHGPSVFIVLTIQICTNRRVREDFRCDLSYLGTYAADRQQELMRILNGTAELLPQYEFIVASQQYPNDTRWRPNVARIIHLFPPEHPAFYSSSRFTLNLTRDDMIAAGYSASVRLFEASACGSTILSDSWRGLDDFFYPRRGDSPAQRRV